MKRALFAAVIVLLPACSLAFGLDGYEGKGTSDGGNPANTSSSSSTSSSGSSGTNIIDAGANSDGSFCPTSAVFCDDFERSATSIKGSWGQFNPSGGTAKLVTGTPTGAAFEVAISANADPTNGFATVDLTKDLGTTKSSASITSRLLIAAVSSTGGMHLNALVFTRGQGASSTIFPYLTGSSITIGELECDPSIPGGCTYSQASVVKPLTLNAWHDVGFSVDFTTTPATLTLVVDGAVTIQEDSDPHAATGPLQAQAAAAYVDAPHDAWDITIDNVVLTAQ